MADNEKSNEGGAQTEIPRYPSMIRCLLLDARHGSRVELQKSISSSELFDSVIEAKSLKSAANMLEANDYDACFIGPSISPELINPFLSEARACTHAKDCAFLVVTNSDDEALKIKYEEGGAHFVILRPCSRAKFFESVVRGVVNANQNGAWASIVKANGGEVIPGGLKEAGSPKATKPASAPEQKPEEVFASILSSPQEMLSPLSSALKSKRITVSEAHEPNDEAKAEVAKIADKILASSDGNSPLMKGFRVFLEKSLLEWIVNVKLSNENEATDQLRIRLLTYYPEKK